MRGYTIKVCLGCSRDAWVSCFHARTPLCYECLHAHDLPDWWDERVHNGHCLSLPPAPRGVRERPPSKYLPRVQPLGRARKRVRPPVPAPPRATTPDSGNYRIPLDRREVAA